MYLYLMTSSYLVIILLYFSVRRCVWPRRTAWGFKYWPWAKPRFASLRLIVMERTESENTYGSEICVNNAAGWGIDKTSRLRWKLQNILFSSDILAGISTRMSSNAPRKNNTGTARIGIKVVWPTGRQHVLQVWRHKCSVKWKKWGCCLIWSQSD